MPCIVAKRPRYCDRFRNSRVDEVPVAAFPAAINETRALKLGDKFSYLLRHEITVGYFVATSPSAARRLRRVRCKGQLGVRRTTMPLAPGSADRGPRKASALLERTALMPPGERKWTL